jgi:hypothetical protein
MDSKDYRKLNARLLVEEVGSVSALAKLAGTAQSYLSQIIGLNGKRHMGDDLARRLEYVTKKPHGWMDTPHIEDEKLQKARTVYENLLRLPIEVAQALVTLTSLGTKTGSDDLGRVELEAFTKVPSSERVTNLGTGSLEQNRSNARHGSPRGGKSDES